MRWYKNVGLGFKVRPAAILPAHLRAAPTCAAARVPARSGGHSPHRQSPRLTGAQLADAARGDRGELRGQEVPVHGQCVHSRPHLFGRREVDQGARPAAGSLTAAALRPDRPRRRQMNRTITVRRDYLHYIKKYNRYEKRHSMTSAHCSPCFIGLKEGDTVTIGQCR